MLTKEQFMHTKSPYDFLFNFLSYTWLNLTNLLTNLLGLSRLNLGLFLCDRRLKCWEPMSESKYDLNTSNVTLYIYSI